MARRPLRALLALALLVARCESFGASLSHGASVERSSRLRAIENHAEIDANDEISVAPAGAADGAISRRSAISGVASTAAISAMTAVAPPPSRAAVGSLPEFADTNAILQGITVNVADQSQEQQLITFLAGGFDFKVLRKGSRETIKDTWMGYGPEQPGIPEDFEMGVSSFGKYGGHASVQIKYDTQTMAPLYRQGDQPPGNNIGFLQVGVPGYRISQMVANGGNIVDAFGHANVISPAGFPMRAIVGVHPDPIMMIAINCEDVQRSAAFYQQLGFAEQEYPYARLSKGTTPFEPAQPNGSIFMAPTPNGLGVLLQPFPKKKTKVVPNPVVESLNVVYTPPASAEDEPTISYVTDPSGVKIRFQPIREFLGEEKNTRIPQE